MIVKIYSEDIFFETQQQKTDLWICAPIECANPQKSVHLRSLISIFTVRILESTLRTRLPNILKISPPKTEKFSD